MNSGAEGVETAMKLARRWAYEKKGIPENQAKIIVCEGNFHGRTISIISASTDPDSWTIWAVHARLRKDPLQRCGSPA